MSYWLDEPKNSHMFSQLCESRTPITIVFSDDSDYTLDCIPVWLTGDAYCVIVDEDDNRYGLKRGQKTMGDFEDIGDVIIREKQPVAKSA